MAEVLAAVPASQLLVFDVREGWAPLCAFLNLPIPAVPFPMVNDSAMLLRTFNVVRALCWFLVLALPALLAALLSVCDTVHSVVWTCHREPPNLG